MFSVFPAEFVPADQITLNETFIDPFTDSPSNHTVGVNFFDFPSGGSNPYLVGSGYASGSSGGVVLRTVPHYPTDGRAHAYSAVIANCTDPGVTSTVSNLASSPVQLTVGWKTTLSLNVQNTSSPSQYKLTGSLMNGIQAVSGGQITLNINGTQLTALTGPDGSYSVTQDFPAENNAVTTYTVAASYAGTNPLTASATSSTLDGTAYTTCTTTQFGYQPSINYTLLTASPQSMLSAVPNKTPEQMLQECKNVFRFSISPVFGPPWLSIDVGLTVGQTVIDATIGLFPNLSWQGLMQGLLGNTLQNSFQPYLHPSNPSSSLTCSGMDIFSQLQDTFVNSFLSDATAMMAEYGFGKLGFWSLKELGAIFAGGALSVEFASDLYFLSQAANNVGQLLAFAIANVLMMAVSMGRNFALAVINLLGSIVVPAVQTDLRDWYAGLLVAGQVIAVAPQNPVDMAEICLTVLFCAAALNRVATLCMGGGR